MNDTVEALIFVAVAFAGCAICFVSLSTQAKRRVAIWLLAKADAQDAAGKRFRERARELRSQFEVAE